MKGTSVLEIHRINDKLRFGFYDKESTVRSYEDIDFPQTAVEQCSSAMLELLNAASHTGGTSASLYDGLRRHGRLLFDLLLPPSIKSRLHACHSGHLIIHIDDALTPVPWELLFDGNQFLCLRFSTGRQLATARPVVSLSPTAARFPAKMLILANPTADLPAAATEAELLCADMDSVKDKITAAMKAGQVSKDYFRKHVRDYNILHYAGHAEYTPGDPLQTGWVLSDGKLTTTDIARMGSLPMPAMVFMNSCQSAVAPNGSADKEAILFNVADAFLQAGVRHVVGTLWRIPDADAPALARDFYRSFAAGASIGESLKVARQRALETLGQDHISWASYVLYGDPSVSWNAATPSTPPERGQHTQKILFGTISLACLIAAAGAGLWFVPTMNPFAYSKVREGGQLFAAGQYALAAKRSQEALDLDPKYAQARLQLAHAYEKLGQYEEAQASYDLVKNIYLKHNRNPADLIFLYVDMARNAYAHEDYTRSEDYLTKILNSPHAKLAPQDVLLFYRALANVYFLKGKQTESLNMARQSLHLALNGTSKADIARAYVDLAQVTPAYPAQEAKEVYKKGLLAAQAARDISLQAKALAGLGDLAAQHQEYAAATKYYKEAAGLLKGVQDKSARATIALNVLYLKEAIADIDLLNFSGATQALKNIQAPPALPSEGIPAQLARTELTLFLRRFEYLLQHLAQKGYKNSDLYQKAGAIYDTFI